MTTREQYAHAMYGAEYSIEAYPWENVPPDEQKLYLQMADAILALSPLGEPTGGSRYDDPMFNAGVQHVVELLAKTCEVTDWVAGDGSEDYNDDLAVTLLNILAARGLFDKDEGTFPDLAALRASVAGWQPIETALKNLMQAAKSMPLWTPSGGGASTKHTYQIAAAEVWALDRALREANEALAKLPAAPHSMVAEDCTKKED